MAMFKTIMDMRLFMHLELELAHRELSHRSLMEFQDIYLFIYLLFIYLFIYLFIHSFIIYSFIYLFIYYSFIYHLFIYLFIHLFILHCIGQHEQLSRCSYCIRETDLTHFSNSNENEYSYRICMNDKRITK